VEEGECSGSSRLAESKEEPESLEFCLTEWDRGGMKGGGLEEVGGAGGRGFIAADVMFLLTGGGGGVSSP
jgi:hypothetical protein